MTELLSNLQGVAVLHDGLGLPAETVSQSARFGGSADGFAALLGVHLTPISGVAGFQSGQPQSSATGKELPLTGETLPEDPDMIRFSEERSGLKPMIRNLNQTWLVRCAEPSHSPATESDSFDLSPDTSQPRLENHIEGAAEAPDTAAPQVPVIPPGPFEAAAVQGLQSVPRDISNPSASSVQSEVLPIIAEGQAGTRAQRELRRIELAPAAFAKLPLEEPVERGLVRPAVEVWANQASQQQVAGQAPRRTASDADQGGAVKPDRVEWPTLITVRAPESRASGPAPSQDQTPPIHQIPVDPDSGCASLAVVAAPIADGTQSALALPDRSAPRADFSALVDRLIAAREAVQPQAIELTVRHADFGSVSLRFRAEAAGLRVDLNSPDADFARVAGAVIMPVAAPRETQVNADHLQHRHQPAGQPAAEGNSQSRSGAAPHRRDAQSGHRPDPMPEPRQPRTAWRSGILA